MGRKLLNRGMNYKLTAGFSIKLSLFYTWLGVVYLAGIITFSGCDFRTIAERVTTIDFSLSRVATSEQTLDFDIFLRPQDAKGHTIEAPGILDAKLWLQIGSDEKGKLLNKWTGIQVAPESYEQNRGSLICFQYSEEYKGYPAFLQSGDLDLCCGNSVPYDLFSLELTFTIDGKTLVCTKTDLCLYVVMND